MTTGNETRRILANAHAAWIASNEPQTVKIAQLKTNLVEASYVASTDILIKACLIGTSLQVWIDADDYNECIELDAYGNVLRGTI